MTLTTTRMIAMTSDAIPTSIAIPPSGVSAALSVVVMLWPSEPPTIGLPISAAVNSLTRRMSWSNIGGNSRSTTIAPAVLAKPISASQAPEPE